MHDNNSDVPPLSVYDSFVSRITQMLEDDVELKERWWFKYMADYSLKYYIPSVEEPLKEIPTVIIEIDFPTVRLFPYFSKPLIFTSDISEPVYDNFRKAVIEYRRRIDIFEKDERKRKTREMDDKRKEEVDEVLAVINANANGIS